MRLLFFYTMATLIIQNKMETQDAIDDTFHCETTLVKCVCCSMNVVLHSGHFFHHRRSKVFHLIYQVRNAIALPEKRNIYDHLLNTEL